MINHLNINDDLIKIRYRLLLHEIRLSPNSSICCLFENIIKICCIEQCTIKQVIVLCSNIKKKRLLILIICLDFCISIYYNWEITIPKKFHFWSTVVNLPGGIAKSSGSSSVDGSVATNRGSDGCKMNLLYSWMR